MRTLLYREAIREAIAEEMERDESVFVMGEDVGRPFGGADKITEGLWEMFGDERVRNTPITEEVIAGAAVGAALVGMRPVVEIMYFDFILLAMDQIVNQAAKVRYMSGGQARVPMVIRTVCGAGRSSAAHHSQSLESWFVHVPGLVVVMPSTPYDAKGLLKSAIRDDNPVLFIEPKLCYQVSGEAPEDEYLVPLGKADVKREGRDVTIVAMGNMVSKAMAAAEVLSSEGIEAEVIDPRTLSPLDLQTIVESVRKTGRLIITHQAVEQGGVGAEIATRVTSEAFDYLDAPVERVAAKNAPTPFAPILENSVLPQTEDIVAAARSMR